MTAVALSSREILMTGSRNWLPICEEGAASGPINRCRSGAARSDGDTSDTECIYDSAIADAAWAESGGR